MSVQVSYKKQSVLGIFGLIIILFVIELAANVWWLNQITCEFENSDLFRNMNDDEKRQICTDLYFIRTSGDSMIPNQRSDTININSFGFRGDEFSSQVGTDTYRIFMLGGSTMFGTGATSDSTTIPGYLQSMFDQKHPEFDIEIINAGIQGATSETELKLIENKLSGFSPNMVIIYDGWNDLRINHNSEQILENWNKICNLGIEKNFDVVISLQPLAGFGKKILTDQEHEYVKNGVDYNNKKLIDLLPVYNEYENNLSILTNCDLSLNLRHVFDNEIESIYWDQGHVSDKGNNIIANSFYENLNYITTDRVPSKISEISASNVDDIDQINTENIVRDIISNYKTPVMITEIFSLKETNVINLDESSSDQLIFQTNIIQYQNREINQMIELSPSNFIESENKIITISTYDKTNNEEAKNVTYFLSISKDGENLLREYFYVKEKFLILKINTIDSESIKTIGEKQYDHNAYVMMDEPITIEGPIFLLPGDYEFRIDLRTIDDSSNWIFDLDGFKSQISLKD